MEEQVANLEIYIVAIFVMNIILLGTAAYLLIKRFSEPINTFNQKYNDWTKSIVEKALVSIAEKEGTYYYIPQWVYIRKYYNNDVYEKSKEITFGIDNLSDKAKNNLIKTLESEHVQHNTKIVFIVNVNVTKGHTNWNSITATTKNVEKIIAESNSIGYTERIALENKFNINN